MMDSPQPAPDAAAIFQQAVQVFVARDWAAAELLCRQTLAVDPRHANALHMLALVLKETGRFEEAIGKLQEATAYQPNDFAQWINLGELYRLQGRFGDAAASQRQAIRLNPNSPEAHHNLGVVLSELGQFADAIAAETRATQLRPGYAKAHYQLGNLLREEGRLAAAIGAYEAAIRLQPDWTDAHFFVGIACFHSGLAAKALAHFQEVVRLEPSRTVAQQAIGHALTLLGRIAEAKAAYALAGVDSVSVLARESLAEPIAADQHAIDDYKARVSAAITSFVERGEQLRVANLQTEIAVPGMSLPYYGGNLRPLMEQFAAAVGPQIPQVSLRPRGRKPKLGIVVTLMHEAVFGRCWGGIAERLSRELFDVRLVCTQGGANKLQEVLKIPPHEFLRVPTSLVEAAQVLAEQEFDWLHYWEIGTSASNYYLPFFRPAPGQSGCWGWPVTSGIPQVNAYLSSAQLEPPDGAAHYSEQLVLMQHLPTYFYRPPAPDGSLGRSHFGLAEDQHVYLCTQNLRKYHPDFDPLLADLLRNDPRGVLLIIGDGQAPVTERLLERFRRTMPDVLSQVRVLPWMQRAEYLALVAVADVALDTVHYGAGANTVYDAVAVGTPLVTLPGEFHRTLWAAAVNRRLGLPQLIAATPQDYVAKAIQAATGADLQQTLRQQIRQAGEQLFEDARVVAEYDSYFSEAIAATRAG